MTELNNFPETDSDRAGASWPAPPAGSPTIEPSGRSVSLVGDASVDAALDRLADIEGLPVDGHAEAYSALHDALLDALNDDDPSAVGGA